MLSRWLGRSAPKTPLGAQTALAAASASASRAEESLATQASAEDQDRSRARDAELKALDQALAIAELNLDGTLRRANGKYSVLLGQGAAPIQHKHHSATVDAESRSGVDYGQIWSRLARGEIQERTFRRIAEDGRRMWLRSVFSPLIGADGKASGILECVNDVTDQNSVAVQVQAAVAEIHRVVKLSIAGDLVLRLHVEHVTGDVAQMVDDVNALLNARMVLVGRVQALARDVRAAGEEIAKGNDTLSRMTESQAASLEETSSSMKEMTGSVGVTADNAALASDLATAARHQAEAGGRVVTNAVTAMAQISGSSKKIADIIGVIDEIAFQTNLLALNAAVEAARAGDLGRGFAVVASEVRSLAGRSATAAKEIKALIQDSVAKVQEGTKLVDASGKTLTDIEVAIKKVHDIVTEIAASSREQSIGVEQVNKAVNQIDEATQQNAALVEETASASQAIVDQIRELQLVIDKYKTSPAPALAGGRRAA